MILEIQADSAFPCYYFDADNTCSSDQRAEQEASFIFEDRHVPVQGSVPFTDSINADNFVSVTGSGEAQPDEGMNDTKLELSPSCGDNKSAYSTVVGFSSASHSYIKNFCVLFKRIFHFAVVSNGSDLFQALRLESSRVPTETTPSSILKNYILQFSVQRLCLPFSGSQRINIM